MKLDFIGIVALVVLIVFIIVGYKKGIFKTIISFSKTILSFLASTFLSKPIANLLVGTTIFKDWSNNIAKDLLSKGDFYAKPYSSVSNSELFNIIKLPDGVKSIFTKLLESSHTTADASVATVLANAAVYYIWIVISFVLVFIAVRLLCMLLNKLVDKADKFPSVKRINHVLGAVLNGLCAMLFISVFMYGLSFILQIPGSFSTLIEDQLELNSDIFTFGKFFYKHNLMSYIISLIQSIF